jgi:hypothetical protein
MIDTIDVVSKSKLQITTQFSNKKCNSSVIDGDDQNVERAVCKHSKMTTRKKKSNQQKKAGYSPQRVVGRGARRRLNEPRILLIVTHLIGSVLYILVW